MDEKAKAFLSFIGAAVQTNIHDIMDLYKTVPDEFAFTFLVGTKLVTEALVPTLSETDKALYDALINNAEIITIKGASFNGQEGEES